MRFQLALVVASLASFVSAHVALWDPAMFGWDPDDPNQSDPVLPLMDLTFSQWWFHGYINKPPATDTFMTLPSGGTYHGQVACNKALTTYGQVPSQQTGLYACDGSGATGGIGAMHTTDTWASPNPTNVKGCGISIAYTSDEKSVQPQDFAVISTNWTCPWFKHVDFQIPSNLPPCPEGGCLCSWGWIHSELSGSEQNYHLVYRCKVDGATGTTAIPAPYTANKCDLPTDTSNCTVGAKQPHYWFQKERNNNPQGTYDPPFYNGQYGFINGAQTDLFASIEAGSSNSSSIASTAQSSTAASDADSSSVTWPATGFPVTTSTAATTTSISGAAASTSVAQKVCRRRPSKRALQVLKSSPDAYQRHQERNAKVALRRSLRSQPHH